MPTLALLHKQVQWPFSGCLPGFLNASSQLNRCLLSRTFRSKRTWAETLRSAGTRISFRTWIKLRGVNHKRLTLRCSQCEIRGRMDRVPFITRPNRHCRPKSGYYRGRGGYLQRVKGYKISVKVNEIKINIIFCVSLTSSTYKITMSSNSRITGGFLAPNSIHHCICKHSSLKRVDYADTFLLTLAQDCPKRLPEQWLRAVFGDVPDTEQKFIWTGLLGLPLLLQRSPATVAGWRIGKQSEDGIQIQNRSWLLSANLIVYQTPDSVSLATLIQFNSLLGRIWWTILPVVHRSFMPSMLQKAEERIYKTS